MKKAGLKIKSQRGATLMLALLMFLICAVLGSVVLMAGTAAAGRMSQLSKMEQRYYAVTSAANLLREKLCTEDSVELVCKKVSTGSDSPSYTLQSTTAPSGEAFLVRLSRVAMFKDSSLLSESLLTDVSLSDVSKWDTFISDASSSTVPEFTVDLEVGGHESLDVTVAVSVNADRTMLLKISNKTAAEKDDKYTLNMTLTPELSRSRSTTTSTAVSGTTETVTTTQTQTARLRWVLSSIQTEGG